MVDEIVAVPLTSGLVEVIKRVGIPGRFAGLLAVLIGVVFSIGLNKATDFSVIVYGVMIGLASSGLYDGVKAGTPNVKTFVNKMVK